MSRGPGYWQRAILAALDQAESFYLVDVLPDGYTRSQYNAAHRGMLRLEADGRISVKHFIYGTPHVVIGRPCVDAERPDSGGLGRTPRRQRPSVGVPPDPAEVQHLTVSDGVDPTYVQFNTYAAGGMA
jgi:hypothetical protein